MAMELVRSTLIEERLDGKAEFVLSAGDKMRIQKQVDGQLGDVLSLRTVPTGKTWVVTTVVRIMETDA